MGLFRGRKLLASAAAAADHDKVEGLIINGGVVAALLLSFSMPLLLSLDRTGFQLGDFQILLNTNMDFRLFIVDIMDSYHPDASGTPSGEGFRWRVPIEGGRTLDVKKLLLQSETFGLGHNRLWNQGDQLRQDMEFAFQALSTHVPLWQVSAWRARHPGADADGTTDIPWVLSQVATSMLVVTLSASTFLYVSLTLSDGKEDAAAMRRWNVWGLPFALLTYIANVVATVLLCSSFHNLTYYNSPNFRQAVYGVHVSDFCVFLPGFFVAVVPPVLALRRSRMKSEEPAKEIEA